MSSYLTFYLIPKKVKTFENMEGIHEIKLSEGVPLRIDCFSRSSNVYQYFYNNLNIAYCGKEDKYTEITPENFNTVLEVIKNDAVSLHKRIKSYYKALQGPNFREVLGDIEVFEEEHTDLLETYNYVKGLKTFIENATDKYSGDFEKCVANID